MNVPQYKQLWAKGQAEIARLFFVREETKPWGRPAGQVVADVLSEAKCRRRVKTMAEFARDIGLRPAEFYRRLEGHAEFSVTQFARIFSVLRSRDEELGAHLLEEVFHMGTRDLLRTEIEKIMQRLEGDAA